MVRSRWTARQRGKDGGQQQQQQDQAMGDPLTSISISTPPVISGQRPSLLMTSGTRCLRAVDHLHLGHFELRCSLVAEERGPFVPGIMIMMELGWIARWDRRGPQVLARLQHRSMPARFAVTPADINGEHVQCGQAGTQMLLFGLRARSVLRIILLWVEWGLGCWG